MSSIHECWSIGIKKSNAKTMIAEYFLTFFMTREQVFFVIQVYFDAVRTLNCGGLIKVNCISDEKNTSPFVEKLC